MKWFSSDNRIQPRVCPLCGKVYFVYTEPEPLPKITHIKFKIGDKEFGLFDIKDHDPKCTCGYPLAELKEVNSE